MEGEFIVDFQAFKDQKNRYILKELAILAVQSDEVAHCLIKPPYAACKLPGGKRASIDYLTEKHHGIIWEDGYTNFTDAVALLKDVTRHAKYLYIKGSERAKFLKLLTGKDTIDFDTLSCPKAKYLSNNSVAPDCFYYRHAPKYHCYFEACSLRRVYKIKKWYLEYLQNLRISSVSTSEDEYDTTEEGHDVSPSHDEECICSGRVTVESKFARSSHH